LIIDGQENFHTDPVTRHKELNLWRGQHLKHLIVNDSLIMDPIRAEVNHSRWIANCPWCNGAEFVFLELPRFHCSACDNDGQHKYVPVVLPPERIGIEIALNKRSRLENRNWKYPETVGDLNKENNDRGIV